MNRALPAVLFALASLACAQNEVLRSTTDVYPGEWTIARGEERWLCYRVVDDASGAPIADAELFLVPEKKAPLAGVFWSTRRAVSDADGFVRVRVDDIEGQWDIQVLRAPGRAVSSRSSPRGEPIWRVAAAQDVPVLVRDWRGNPVAGARIGFCGSCGHGPDLVNATSGADGIAILRGIDPHNDIADLYCQARGLELGYMSVEWRPGDAPYELVCEYSTPLTGKLLDSAGDPIAGAFVGVPDVHRGPWAETRADGTFEVLGAPEGSWLMARVGEREIWFSGSASQPAVLRAPAADAADPHAGLVDDPAPESAEEIATTSIEVRSAEPDQEIWAVGPRVGWTNAANGRIEVPSSGPFVLRVGDRRVAFGDVNELPPQPIVLADHTPTIVRGDVVDADGKPVAVRATLRLGSDQREPATEAPTGAFELPVRAKGTVLLELAPEREDLRTRSFYVALPARGDAVRVDVGRITLVAEPRLRVLDAHGAPLAGCVVRFGRPGFFEVRGEPRFALDERGGWTGPDPRAGDWIEVDTVILDDEQRITLPFRTVLAGDGPWTITPPTGALKLEVRGLAESEGGAHALIADQVHEIRATSDWVGLAPGPLRMWITAPGRRTAIVDTVIPTKGAKVLAVELIPL